MFALKDVQIKFQMPLSDIDGNKYLFTANKFIHLSFGVQGLAADSVKCSFRNTPSNNCFGQVDEDYYPPDTQEMLINLSEKNIVFFMFTEILHLEISTTTSCRIALWQFTPAADDRA